MITTKNYSKQQLFSLLILRLFVGWHFLYEGVSKILTPGWTAKHYLTDSQGFFSDIFHWIANQPTLLAGANYIQIIGLTAIGLALILGCCSRLASIGGILFLLLFYLSHPPFIGANYMMPTEGSYLWIDKNMIEIAVLLVLIYFPTSQIIGLDVYVSKLFKKSEKEKI